MSEVSFAGVDIGVVPDDVQAVVASFKAADSWLLANWSRIVYRPEMEANLFIQELRQRGYVIEKVVKSDPIVVIADAIEDEISELDCE